MSVRGAVRYFDSHFRWFHSFLKLDLMYFSPVMLDVTLLMAFMQPSAQ